MTEVLAAQGFNEKGFHVLPRRWVVEWLCALSRDFEALPETEEAWCSIAMSRLLLHRLVNS